MRNGWMPGLAAAAMMATFGPALPAAAAAASAPAAASPPAAAPAPSPAPAPDTLQFHAVASLTDTLLDRFAGVWQGSPPGDRGSVDRLLAQWKYEHTVMQLQSKVTSGPRREYETVAFLTREPDDRYRMVFTDASGAVLCLEGRAEALVLTLTGARAAGQVRLRYDLSRRGRLTMTREEVAGAGEFRKVGEVEYLRGRLKGR